MRIMHFIVVLKVKHMLFGWERTYYLIKIKGMSGLNNVIYDADSWANYNQMQLFKNSFWYVLQVY